MGVFDGHGGGACAQVVAKRLFNYVTACLLPSDSLNQYASTVSNATSKPPDLIQTYNDKVQFVEDVRGIYEQSFVDFVRELSKVIIRGGGRDLRACVNTRLSSVKF